MRPTLAAFAILVLAQVGQAQLVQYPPIELPPLNLADQFQKMNRLTSMKGDVVVLIYGDRKSADRNKEIGEWLHVAFHPGARGLPPKQARAAPVTPLPGRAPDARHPDVKAIPVACVGSVPTLVGKIIRNQIRKGSPDVPVWLDFDDTMKKRFGLTPKVPNLVVIDKAGRLRYGAKGNLDEPTLRQLAEMIQKLRQEPINNK